MCVYYIMCVCVCVGAPVPMCMYAYACMHHGRENVRQ